MIKSKGFNTIIKEATSYIFEGKKSGNYVFEPAFEAPQNGTSIINGKEVVMLTSNNYLGLSTHPEIIEAEKEALEKYGTGTCGARLHNGTTILHTQLEERCADFFNTEAAVITSAGYLANLAAISSVASGDDAMIITDQLNHMSIVDGNTLSGAKIRIFTHNDIEKLRYILERNQSCVNKLIVVEGVYSMEGDLAPLDKIMKLAEEYEVSVLVDEAHSMGFVGENGRGASELFGVEDKVHMRMTTFSKSLANVGGCIATDKETALYIKHQAHPYIFNASMPPAIAAGILKAFDVLEKEKYRIDKLWENTIRFRRGIMEMGFDTMGSTSPIVPIYIGDDEKNMSITKELLQEGVYIATAVFPAVPQNESRLRATITASLNEQQIDYALGKIEKIGHKYNLI
ncbi:MAG: aminotransferase class I/II-fold pyridoxal phosphate-dependent enzyme [Anaerocolumna sp.]